MPPFCRRKLNANASRRCNGIQNSRQKRRGSLLSAPAFLYILFCTAIPAAFMPLYTHIMRHTVYQMAHSPFLPLPVIFVPGVPIIKSTCIMERFTPAAVI